MSSKTHRPYAVIGSESLTSSLYKSGDELVGFQYRFNITRLNARTGRVSQWFAPADVIALVKLTQVIASELQHDGCMNTCLRDELRGVAVLLDEALDKLKTEYDSTGDKIR
ncbi:MULTISPECIES: hypothetical protein [Rhodopirellula]|uniref:hypothetical protein n=1 Tax=Rhodopirellula TaxID=265488 RepID=UPI001F2BAA1A|nr:hypothetical protein [Rhodopirellula europaea]